MNGLSIRLQLEIAKKYAPYAIGAYLSSKEGREFFESKGCTFENFYSEKSTQFYHLIDTDGVHTIVFRGTDLHTADDLKTDVNFKKIQLGKGMCHHGFFTAVDDVYFLLKHKLGPLLKEGARVRFVGHSLGSSCSVVAAFRLSSDFGSDKIEVISFGGPKVGDQEFAEEFSELIGDRFLRVVNDKDVVPLLPTKYKFDYEHHSKALHIDDYGGVYELFEKASVYLRIATGVVALLASWADGDESTTLDVAEDYGKELLTDHQMVAYVIAIDEAISKLTVAA